MSKRNVDDYAVEVKNFSDDELHKEIWMLDTHLQYLKSNNEADVKYIQDLLEVAKDEKERRLEQRYYV